VFRIKKLAITVVALTALALTGCAAGGDAPATSDEPVETVSLKIGVLPIFDSAAAQVALDSGYFEEEGLDIEIQVFASSSEITPALINGDVKFGLTSLVSNFNGLSQNVPIVSVAPGVYSGVDEDDVTAFIVDADSPIESLDDIEGATVSIIAFKSQADMVTRAMLDKAGVDLSAVNFVEIKFPDLQAGLDADRVDAVTAYEPWQTVLVSAGKKVIAHPFTEVFGEETLTQEWVTTDQYASASPDVVERFQRAIAKANQALADDPDLAREAAATLIPTLDPAVAADLILPIWRAESDRASYDRVLDVMTEYVDYSFEPDFDNYLRLVG
jgi:NitT/TauT family transport system substrate-binding protein